MTVAHGESQTVSIQSFADISGGYGLADLTTTSATYVDVPGAVVSFTQVTDGMKVYVQATCGITADSSSAASAILSISDNGTIVPIAESEVQSDPATAGLPRLGTLLAVYTVAHCGLTGAGTLTVKMRGRRVVGSGNAYVLFPVNIIARLARD